MQYDFLVDTYRTERLKILSVWSQVADARMGARPEPRGRTPHEHMVHQCVSEDTWMRTMLGVTTSLPTLPAVESRIATARGSLANPLTDAELEAKLRTLCEYGQSGVDANRLIAAVWVLEHSLDAGEIMALATPPVQ